VGKEFPQVKCPPHQFTAKLGKKWRGPYRIVHRLGPVNYQVVLESSGEDVKNVHVCNLKLCYPTAEEVERKEHQKLLEIFQDTSDEEEFLGF